jgi:CHAT domain
VSRTVVSIFFNPNNDQVNFNLDRAPGNFPNARDLYAFECTENDPPFMKIRQRQLGPDIVKCAGERLYDNLSKHPAVREAIAMALTITQDNVAPLYVHLNSEKAEALPWETLFAAGNFLTLDRRWQIARIADTAAMVQAKNLTFRPPLKVSLVLSAAGVDSTPQWDAFYNSLRGTAIELVLQVFVCQRELKVTIEGLNDPQVNVQVEFLQSRSDLLEKVKNFAPHILHFFCHGSTEGGPYLQLATLADWEGGDPRGSIAIAPDDLYPFSTSNVSGYTWLVVLNCCEGAAPVANAATAEDAYSLARLLVTNGFCAAVGMREPIASDDAHTFCQAFYPSVLAILQELQPQQKNVKTDFTEVEWARALHGPRAQLRDKYRADKPPLLAAAASREWTLPIIYVRPELFMLRVRFTNPLLTASQIEVLRAQIKLLRNFRQTHPDVPQGALDDIDTQIADLEAQLYA